MTALTALSLVLAGPTLSVWAEDAAADAESDAPAVVLAADDAAAEPAAEEKVTELAAEEVVEEAVEAEEADVEAAPAEEATDSVEAEPVAEASADEAEPAAEESTDEAEPAAEEAAVEEAEGEFTLGDVSTMAVDTAFWPYDYETIADAYGTDDDDVYVQGSKENDLGTWSQGHASPTQNGDIVNAYVGAEVVNGDPMLYVGLDRYGYGGNNGFFLELNQEPNTTNGNGATIPNRTDGDLRLIFPAADQFSTPTVQVWDNGAWRTATVDGVAFQSDNYTAEFKFNLAKLLEDMGREFECNDSGFKSLFLRSGASSTDSSQLKDFVTGAIDINFCAAMLINKVDEDGKPLGGATFEIDPNPLVGATESPLTIKDNDANDMDPADGVISLPEINPGTYTVTETVAPEGYLLPKERSQTLTVDENGSITFYFADPMIWDAPTITKTADATYSSEYKWAIDKKANGEDGLTATVRAGESYDIEYTISVELLERVTQDYSLVGEITVVNPNDKPMDATVTDIVNGNHECTVDVENPVELAPGENTFTYVCSEAEGLAPSGTNVASVTYDNADYPSTQAHVDDPATAGETTVDTDPVAFDFTDKTATNRTVTVTDTFAGEEAVELGKVTAGADGTTVTVEAEDGTYTIDGKTVTFTLKKTITPEPGSCEALTNTAQVVDLTDTVEVEVCADADLMIEKTVNGSYGVAHDWSIEKSVAPVGNLRNETDATLDYTVVVTYEGSETDVGTVSGEITVTNPNDWDKDYKVVDVFAGADCVVTDATGTLAAGESKVLPYTCEVPEGFAPVDGQENVATVEFELAGETVKAEAKAPITWDMSETGNPVDVKDFFGDEAPVDLGTITVGEDVKAAGDQVTYEYSKDVTVPLGECMTFKNVAKVFDGEIVVDEDDASEEICSEADLAIEKTVTGSYDLTHLWSIEKSVDSAKIELLDDDTATLSYDVVVTYDGSEVSGVKVAGTIAVSNPNTWDKDYTVTDVFAGAECDVTNATGTIPAGETVELDYTCTVPSDFAPSADDVNVATVSAQAKDGGPMIVESDPVTVDWDVTELQNPVDVVDVFGDDAPVDLGTITVGDQVTEAGDTVTYEYSKDVTVPEGECMVVKNVAKVVDGEVVIDEDEETTEICAEADLVVTKTVESDVEVTYGWKIEKTADKTDFGKVEPGSEIKLDYTVVVTPDGYEVTKSDLKGEITVVNPNKYKSVDVAISDVVSDEAWTCEVDGAKQTVEAGGTVTLGYTCQLASDAAPEAEAVNTVTVTWGEGDDAKSVEFEQPYTLDVTEINKVVKVKDLFNGKSEFDLGEAEWNPEGTPIEFDYTRTVNVGNIPGKHSLDNLAWIVETGDKDDETVTFEIPETKKPCPDPKPCPTPKPKPKLPKTGVGGSNVTINVVTTVYAVRRDDER